MRHDLDIPDFLRIPQSERAASWKDWTSRSTFVAPDRNSERYAAFKARKKEKSRGRVGRMLAKMSDRDAVRAGLTWDVMRGGWR